MIGFIDYTLLDEQVSNDDLRIFCEKARVYHPATVCIFPDKIQRVREILGEDIRITAVVGGFPIGSNDNEEIRKEIISAINLGADEIDIIIEPRESEDYPNEIELEKLVMIREASNGNILKVIIETPYLVRKKLEQLLEWH